MDEKKLDEMLKKEFNKNMPEIPVDVEKAVDQALEELPEHPPTPRRFSKGVTYWLTGVACALFAIILISYMQSANLDEATVYQSGELTIEEELDLQALLATQIEPPFNYGYLDDVKVLTSYQDKDRWIAIISFGEDKWPFVTAIEIRENDEEYEATFIKDGRNIINLTQEYSHWYLEDEGIGFGTADNRNYIEKVVIDTKDDKIESIVHNEAYIYVSKSKPEKVQFLADTGKVMNTMETFNFDEQYKLIAYKEGKLAIFSVADYELEDIINYLWEQGIHNINSAYSVDSLETANEEFPFLQLEKSPAYAVFDHKEMIYKTYDREDLIRFLEEYDEVH